METPIEQSTRSLKWLKGAALLAAAFGLVTLFSSGYVLFGADNACELAGTYVQFVVWFNFPAGFFCVLAGIGIWLGRTWAFGLSALIAAATAATALVFSSTCFWAAPSRCEP